MKHILPVTAGRNAAGQFTLAGHELHALVAQYGSPLYLYDGETVRAQSRQMLEMMRQAYPGESEITFAAKAYFAPKFAAHLAALGLGVDVISSSELTVARRAGFAPDRVHLHGNNKSEDEMRQAIAWGVHSIVVDSLEELETLNRVAGEMGQTAPVWLRVTPGLTVDTHPYRQTAHPSSKFGLPMQDGQAAEAIRGAMNAPHLRLAGLHTHLGSQIFETEPYERAIAMLVDLAEACGYVPGEISPGGGWGVPYTAQESPADPELWVATVSEAVQTAYARRGWPLPRLVVEPGRFIAARAGLAVYTVGTHKTTGDGTRIIAVDGGMADNPRPALYHAEYNAFLADQPDATPTGKVRVVGKFCETGDLLIPEAELPPAKRGDLLVIPVAGAYQLSMASNYNLAPRPASLWVEPGQVEVLQPREKPEDSLYWG